jgi:hypothetical protein
MNIELAELARYCKQYDSENDSYPESEWEGRFVFEYILDCLVNDSGMTNAERDNLIESLGKTIDVVYRDWKNFNREYV